MQINILISLVGSSDELIWGFKAPIIDKHNDDQVGVASETIRLK